METSEIDRLRDRVAKLDGAPRPRKRQPAQSFRLGPDHIERLQKLAERSGIPQVEVLRALIDKEHLRVQEARANRPAE